MNNSQINIKIIALLLAALMLAVCFAGCESVPQGGDDTTDSSASGDATDVPADNTEAPVVIGDFEITPEVKIVRPDKTDATVKSAAEVLAKAIEENLGFTCKLITDWSLSSGAEIVIGECTRRPESVEFNDGFYPDGYGYAVLSENVIAISALSSDNVYRAVRLFISEVIEKKTAKLQVGSDHLKSNEKPNVSYTLNGQPLDSFVIVSENVSEKAAVNIREYIKEYLLSNLDIVTPAEYKGGNAIKLGNFGIDSHFGYRYKVGSGIENGNAVIMIDGENEALREKAVEFVQKAYMTASLKNDNFVIPECVYGYKADNYGATGLYQVSSESTELAEGVTYYRKHYNNNEGKNVDVFITVVSGDSKARFVTRAADPEGIKNGKDVVAVKTVGVLAGELKSEGFDVLAACNAGFFQKAAGTNYPWGMQIDGGEVLFEPSTAKTSYSDNWVGITFDGKLVCGNTKDYESTYKGKLEYGVGCGYYLLKDGKLKMQSADTALNPYTAVALTSDGGFVIICVDGRPNLRNGKSESVSRYDMVTLLWDLDLNYTDAYILDGGGSTEMVVKEGNALKTQNDPSDGKSRPLTDIIAVVISE